MNRNRINRFRTPFIIALSCIALVSLTKNVAANPRGIPAGWKKEYQFNLIGFGGKEYLGGCGSGNRVFVNRDARNASLTVTNGDYWNITDCNATGGHGAELTSNEAGRYAVFVRILGRPGGTLQVCADEFVDSLTGDTLCLQGTINLTRGKGQTKFGVTPATMFDASLENILWTIDTNRDFRIAQFRVYRIPAP